MEKNSEQRGEHHHDTDYEQPDALLTRQVRCLGNGLRTHALFGGQPARADWWRAAQLAALLNGHRAKGYNSHAHHPSKEDRERGPERNRTVIRERSRLEEGDQAGGKNQKRAPEVEQSNPAREDSWAVMIAQHSNSDDDHEQRKRQPGE